MSGNPPELRLLAPDRLPLAATEEAALVEALARLLLRHQADAAAGSAPAAELDVSQPDSAPRSP